MLARHRPCCVSRASLITRISPAMVDATVLLLTPLVYSAARQGSGFQARPHACMQSAAPAIRRLHRSRRPGMLVTRSSKSPITAHGTSVCKAGVRVAKASMLDTSTTLPNRIECGFTTMHCRQHYYSGLQVHWCSPSRAETSERSKDKETLLGPGAPFYCAYACGTTTGETSRRNAFFRSFRRFLRSGLHQWTCKER